MFTITNEDCMDLMARYKNNAFDLAVVDPPFGTGQTWKKDTRSPFYHHQTNYKNNEPPGAAYFAELFRVSKRQIIFGANYYAHELPERNSWIFWDKCSSQSFRSAGEFIWTSFNHPAAVCRFAWNGHYRCCPRIGGHPHEKPVELYKWLLANYARHDWNILDTHMGSGTIAVACHDAGLDLTACEIDKTYYNQAMGVINTHIAQQSLFPVKELTIFQSLFEEAV